MKARVVLMAVAALLAVALIAARLSHHTAHTEEASTPSAPRLPSSSSDPQTAALPQPRRPSPVTATATPKSDPVLSPPCRAFWGNLRTVDLSRLSRTGAGVTPPESHGCTLPAGLPSNLREAHSRYQSECAKSGNPTMPCLAALAAYRALVVDWETRATPLASISDKKLLVDKLGAAVGRNPTQAAAVADRLLEVDPGNYGAAKASALSHLAELQPNSPDTDTAALDRASRALERAAQTEEGRKDPEILQAQALLSARRNDWNGVESAAESLSQRFPKSGQGAYTQAWVEYQRGDADSFFSHLKTALQKEPNNPAFQQTWEAAHQMPRDLLTSVSKNKPRIFQSQLGFGMPPPPEASR